MRAQVSIEYVLVLAILLALFLAIALPALSGYELGAALAALRAAGAELELSGLKIASIAVIEGVNVTLAPKIFNSSGGRIQNGVASRLAARVRDAIAPNASIVNNCFASARATYCINLTI